MIFFKTKPDDFCDPMATVTDICPGIISAILSEEKHERRLYPLIQLLLFEKTQPKQHRSDPLQRSGLSTHIFMMNAKLEALIGYLANGS